MVLIVRLVSTGDAQSVQTALDSVARERRYILMVEAPALEDVQRFIDESLRSDQPYYVAADGNEIAGFCAISRRKEAGFGHVGRLGMGVVSGFRRKGLGRQLLTAAMAHGARIGMARVELEVFSSNTAAIHLYESCGFVQECVRRRVRYLDGIWNDMVQMVWFTNEAPPARGASANPIIGRIERQAGVHDLASVLAHMPPSDLQSLLLEVQGQQAARRPPSRVLSDYAERGFFRPSKLHVVRLREWELLACSRLPKGFEVIELSPVCPLGTSSVLAGVSQNWAVSTVRNSEVVSDPTNVMALEIALRRKQAVSSRPRSVDPIHMAANHRVLRPQFYNKANLASHFSLFALCSAGRDTGDRRFEITALVQHVRFYVEILRQFLGSKVEIIVSVSDFAPVSDRERLENDLLEPICEEFTNVTCHIDNERQAGRGYYRDLCCKIHVQVASGEKVEVADGGSVDWTSKLLSDEKERIIVSGIGSERVCQIAEAL